MTIQYSDGKALEAVLLSRTETTLRAAIQGADDVVEFSSINGVWVSEDCEPVRIVFEWQRRNSKRTISEADFACSQELAGRLIHLLSGAAPWAARLETAPQPAELLS
jgi:hypothetical protein